MRPTLKKGIDFAQANLMNLSNGPEQSGRQTVMAGSGSLYHRIYSIEFTSSTELANKAMEELKSNINAFSPQLIAKFRKTRGDPGVLKSGDEFDVEIPGPWKAPVRVFEVHPQQFGLCTLNGHIEAGDIIFSLKKIDENKMHFEIESIARSKDAIIDFLYDKVGIMRFVQGEMWKCFCENFAALAALHVFTGQQNIEQVKIFTEKQDEETKQWIQI